MNVDFRTGFVLWLIVIFGGLGMVLLSIKEIQKDVEEDFLVELGSYPNSPTCLHMYNIIEKYRKEYDVPAYIAYNIQNFLCRCRRTDANHALNSSWVIKTKDFPTGTQDRLGT